MTETLRRPAAVATLVEDEPATAAVKCPMCHADAPLQLAAIEAGGTWHCPRCGQHWDAERLATVAAYAVWASELEHADRRPAASAPSTSSLGSIAFTRS